MNQEKIACEATTLGWVCPGMPGHAQTYLDPLGVPLGSLGGMSR